MIGENIIEYNVQWRDNKFAEVQGIHPYHWYRNYNGGYNDPLHEFYPISFMYQHLNGDRNSKSEARKMSFCLCYNMYHAKNIVFALI